MVIRIKKLFQGKISIRDYNVKECIERDEFIEVRFNNEFMILKVEDLKQGVTDNNIYTSKFGNKRYKLTDFDWKPTDKRQQKLI